MKQHKVMPNSFCFIFPSLDFISLNVKWSLFYYQFLLSVSLISFPPLNSSYISFSMKSVPLTLCPSRTHIHFSFPVSHQYYPLLFRFGHRKTPPLIKNKNKITSVFFS